MKHDMSGAANVVALMAAVAALKPKVEVHAIAAVRREHARRRRVPSRRHLGLARRQDGRDRQHGRRGAPRARRRAGLRARRCRPTSSSTTRRSPARASSRSATTCSGWYANDEAAAREFAARSTDSGEQMWRMPLLEELREQIKSDVADVKQAGDRWGGSITAALFLREFVGGHQAGSTATSRARPPSIGPIGWMQAKGATGHGVLTFLAMIERVARQVLPQPMERPASEARPRDSRARDRRLRSMIEDGDRDPRRRQRRQGQLHDAAPAARAAAPGARPLRAARWSTSTRGTRATRGTSCASTWRARGTTSR